jgi:hypothetical protein
MLYPLWVKWSNDMPLDISHVGLRNSRYIEFTPKGELGSEEDVDAIVDLFYVSATGKGKNAIGGKNKRFVAGKPAEVTIALPYDVYEDALARRDAPSENAVEPEVVKFMISSA